MTQIGAKMLASLAVAGAGMLSTAPASAAEDIHMQALLNDNGSGRLFVNNGTGAPWSWEACSPGLARCAPFARGRKITTAGARPETVFRVRSADGGTGQSPTWHGRVAEVDPPSVNGLIRANELVRASPARWRGGWEGDFDHIQLSACTTPSGKGCTSITDPKYIHGCNGWATVLEPHFTGHYLRVADRRYGAGTVFTLDAVSSPFGHPIWRANRTTAVAMAGRIAPPRGAEKADCDSPLLLRASISSDGAALVRCTPGCRAVLIARRAGRSARIARHLPPARHDGGLSKLRLSRRALARLGCGRCRMVVRIQGGPVVQRTVRLRARPGQSKQRKHQCARGSQRGGCGAR